MQTVGKRIVILGITGSGKSTLARALSDFYGFNCVELDNLFWKPDWERSSDEEFAEKVELSLTKSDSWIVDGNYTRVGSTLIWQRADTFIWLDYPLRINFWRLWKRIWKRFLTQEPMWDAGNKETLWKHFLTTDSLFVWAWQSYPKKKKQYNDLFKSSEFANHCKIHLRSPQETNQWFENIKNDTH